MFFIRSKTNSDNKFPIFHRVQQEEKTETVSKDVESLRRVTAKKDEKTANKARERSRSKSPLMPRSPKRTEKCRSSTNLSGSRLGLSPISLEAPMRPMEFTLSNTNLRARSPLETVGRRLSHGDGGSPPPRLGSHLGGSANLRPQAPVRGDSLGGGATTPRYSRSPAKRGQSFPVFATLRPPPSGAITKSKSPLLSPNSELTCAIGRKLSREWGTSNIDLRISSVPEMGSGMEPETETETETAPQQQQETTLIIEPFSVPEVKMKPQGVIQGAKKPVRRARSHENRDSAKQSIDLPSPRLNVQPVVGGRSVSERTKKQMESELKAIFSARAHHRDLHPP